MNLSLHNVSQIQITERKLSGPTTPEFLTLTILVRDSRGVEHEITLFPTDDHKLTISNEVSSRATSSING